MRESGYIFATMNHVHIHAKKDGITEIDIFGQIGDSFFEEGNTLDTIKAQVETIEGALVVNIASLGGDALEGLAIHDLLASKDNTTVNIVGATASAGAIIASAGDTVNISENYLFLIHNSSSLVFGNADEIDKHADSMRKVDDRMTSVFVSRTGKEESEIRELMTEDKFIDADEALEFGFVDAITKPVKLAARVDMKKVSASKELTDAQKEQIKSTIKTRTMDLTPITDAISALTAKVTALVTPKDTEAKEIKVLDDEEVTSAIEDITTTLDTLGEENKTLEASVETLTADKTALEAELAKYSQTETPVETGEEPTPVEGDEPIEGKSLGDVLLASISTRLKSN